MKQHLVIVEQSNDSDAVKGILIYGVSPSPLYKIFGFRFILFPASIKTRHDYF